MRLPSAALLASLLAGCAALPNAPTGPERKASVAEALPLDRLPCGPRRQLIDFLGSVWAQRPVALGLATPGGLIAQPSVIEILATADGASWTAILTAPTGVSCVLAGGEAWQPLAEIGAGYQQH